MNKAERIVLDDNEKENKITNILYGYPKERNIPPFYIDVTKESIKLTNKKIIVIPGGNEFSDLVREKYFGYDKTNKFFRIKKEKEIVILRKNGERSVYSKWVKLVIKSDYLFNRHFKSNVID